jgi:hypothetical protein
MLISRNTENGNHHRLTPYEDDHFRQQKALDAIGERGKFHLFNKGVPCTSLRGKSTR